MVNGNYFQSFCVINTEGFSVSHKDRVRCKMHHCSLCGQTGSNMTYMWIQNWTTIAYSFIWYCVMGEISTTEGRKKENLLSFLRDISCVMLWYLDQLICLVSNLIIYYQDYMPLKVTNMQHKKLCGLCLSCEDNYKTWASCYLSAISYHDNKHFHK